MSVHMTNRTSRRNKRRLNRTFRATSKGPGIGFSFPYDYLLPLLRRLVAPWAGRCANWRSPAGQAESTAPARQTDQAARGEQAGHVGRAESTEHGGGNQGDRAASPGRRTAVESTTEQADSAGRTEASSAERNAASRTGKGNAGGAQRTEARTLHPYARHGAYVGNTC